jgi:hypothetical protein
MSKVMGVVGATAASCRREIMGEACTGEGASGVNRPESDRAAALGAADRLCLAAAPTFAIMALLTGLPGSGPPEMLCAAASPLSGMAPMYLLMSAFHSAPWLKLISSRPRGRASTPSPENTVP